MDHLRRAQYLMRKIPDDGTGYRRFVNLSFHRTIASLWSMFNEVVKYLNKEYGINPVLIGGLALQHYGVVRFTEDIDILLSKLDYQMLKEDNKISFGNLKFKPGVEVNVLCEGKDSNPNPEKVRDGNTVYPTLDGLIYLKLIANRLRDEGDIAELIKANKFSEDLKSKMLGRLNDQFASRFLEIWNRAVQEFDNTKNIS